MSLGSQEQGVSLRTEGLSSTLCSTPWPKLHAPLGPGPLQTPTQPLTCITALCPALHTRTWLAGWYPHLAGCMCGPRHPTTAKPRREGWCGWLHVWPPPSLHFIFLGLHIQSLGCSLHYLRSGSN